MSNILGLKWKIGTVIGLIGLIVAASFLFMAQSENSRLSKLNGELDAQINDPETGYVVRLNQARANVATLDAARARQNDALVAQVAEAQSRLARASAELAAIQRDNQKLHADSAKLMALRPKGATTCQRLDEIDAAVLETLK